MLKNCLKGTLAARISQWRSTLRNSHVLSVTNIPVQILPELETTHEESTRLQYIVIGFGTIERQSLHPQTGTSLIYFDQLQRIGKHLSEIKGPKTTLSTRNHTECVSALTPILVTDNTFMK